MPLNFREIRGVQYASYNFLENDSNTSEHHPWIGARSRERACDASSTLCAICSSLNFDFLFSHVLNELQVTADKSTGFLTDGIRLGRLERIKRNRKCQFCNLIYLGLQRNEEVLSDNPFSGDKVPSVADEHKQMECYLDNRISPPELIQTDASSEVMKKSQRHIELRVRTQQPDEASSNILLRKSSKDVIIQQLHTESTLISQSHPHHSISSGLSGLGVALNDTVNPTQLRKWIRDCLDKETSRPKDEGPHSKPRFPLFRIRLIDVKRHCLVQPSHIPPFVALSYIWGKIDALILTEEKLAIFQEEGWLSPANHVIPQTIRDAITACSLIGESFLWVDSLCIVQDTNDRHIQIQHMDTIYNEAKLTIIATAGLDANAGLPGIKVESRGNHQHVACIQGKRMANVLPPESVVLRTSKWSYRGWTLQEELLSPRKLYFTKYQVYFICSHGVCREDSTINVHDSERCQRCTDHVIDDDNTANIVKYQHLVGQYTNRELTYQTDALAAFEGIGSYICKRDFKGSQMIAGIPQCILDLGLLWFPRSRLQRRVDQARDSYPFPSWSWSGWDGCVEYFREESETTLSRVKWLKVEDLADRLTPELTGMPNSSWKGWLDWERHVDESSNIYYTCKTDSSQRKYCHPIVQVADASSSPFDSSTGHLHFLADVVHLTVTDEKAVTDDDVIPSVYHLAVRDAEGHVAGTIYVDANTYNRLDLCSQKLYTFIKLSQTTLRTDQWDTAWHADTQAYSGVPGEPAVNIQSEIETPEDLFDSYFDATLCYCLYNVIMVKVAKEISFRMGLGVIHISAFDNANPEERKITLG